MENEQQIDILEERLQADCYLWFHNTYPQYRGLLCYNLNNSRNKIEASKNKAMGLQKGRSDMVLYFHKKATMLECKLPSGSQSPDQKKWENLVWSQGFDYEIFRSLQEFQEIIKKIIH